MFTIAWKQALEYDSGGTDLIRDWFSVHGMDFVGGEVSDKQDGLGRSMRDDRVCLPGRGGQQSILKDSDYCRNRGTFHGTITDGHD